MQFAASSTPDAGRLAWFASRTRVITVPGHLDR